MSLLVTFLNGRQDALLDCLRAHLRRSLPQAAGLGDAEVLGNLPALLGSFAHLFERSGSAEALLSERLPEAEEHGRRRQRQGFTPDAVALEWGLVRDCLLGELERAGVQLPLAEVRFFAAASSAAAAAATRQVVEADRAALQASAEQLRLMVEGVHDYALIMLDPEGHVLGWNAGAERIYGYRPDEVRGRSFALFYTPLERAAGKPQRVLELTASEGRFEAEGERVRRDGSRFWAHVIFTALHDGRGGLRGFAKVTHDISAQRHAQEMQSFFVRAGHELAGSLDLDVTLRALAELAVEQLAAFCILDLVGEDGRLHRLQVAAHSPRLEALLERLRAFPPEPSSDSPAARVLREGRSLLLSRMTSADLDR
ncbi:MAG TPA: PAS domain S-box protein, partial [Aggregicoccus sp.]|nr:PAS domain S-box protein [Aggregicoccus sp.]